MSIAKLWCDGEIICVHAFLIWLLSSDYLISSLADSISRFIRARTVALFAFFSLASCPGIGFFLTKIPKQLSLLRSIAFDCLSYNFAIRSILNIKFSYWFLSICLLSCPILSTELTYKLAFIRYYVYPPIICMTLHKIPHVHQRELLWFILKHKIL